MKLLVDVNGQTLDLMEVIKSSKCLNDIEHQLGMTSLEVQELAKRGSMTVITAMVWVLLRRSNPDLKFEDVDFDPTTIRQVEDPTIGGGQDDTSTTTSPSIG